MISCRFGGQLGNVMLEIYGVFHYASMHHINFSNVVFNKKYDVSDQTELKKWHYDYINENYEVFSKISSHFIEPEDYERLPFYFCQNKHILHGDDIDLKLHQYICFKKFDFHFPCNQQQRQLFCELFDVPQLKQRILQQFSYYDIQQSYAVHVRRTDFKTFKNGKHLQTAQQISNSIETYLSCHDKHKFIVFSDDINWCEQNIKPRNANIIFAKNHRKDYEDMILMSLAKDILSGISSFSYCAKLLNKNISLDSIKPPLY